MKAPALSEKAFQEQVIDLAKLYGYHVFHPYDSRRSMPGWPDLSIFGHGRFLMAELKSSTGTLRLDQRRVIQQLRSAGIAVFVWRPADLPEIQRVLNHRRHAA